MNQDTTTIEGIIIDALADIGVEAERISLDTSFAELDVDSLDIAELSQIISDRFGVEIRADDAPQLTTVGSLVALVDARR
jgi:acyl carrier protein